MGVITRTENIDVKRPESVNKYSVLESLQRDMERIQVATEPPLRAYGRIIKRIEYINPKMADYIICRIPVTHRLYSEVVYRREHWKNMETQIVGETGSGKSIGGLTLGKMLNWSGQLTPNNLPEHLFFADDAVKERVQSEDIRPGDVLIKDEDPRRFGSGSIFASKTRENIETTVRYDQINFEFIYTQERLHIIHLMLESRAEHYITPGRADYFIYKATVPVSGDMTEIGLLVLEVPDQGLIRAYHKLKENFIRQMELTGGAGEVIDMDRMSKWLGKQLVNDHNYAKLVTGGAQATYISRKFGIPKEVVVVLLQIMGD